MLGLEIAAPIDRILEFLTGGLQELNSLCIAAPYKLGVKNMVEPLEKPLIHILVKEIHFIGASFEYCLYDVFNHCLCGNHVSVEVTESHFRLDHPEFSGVTRRIAVLRAESRTECIDIAERKCKCLAVKLTADGQAAGLCKEIL